MIDVIINGCSANEALDIVYQLRKDGYRQGIEFDFKYNKPVYADWAGDELIARSAVFTFYDEKLATWFNLKYN